MKSTDKFLIIFSILLFVISIYAFTSSSLSVYSQSSSDDTPVPNSYLTYFNPFTMIKIQYPSFWEAADNPISGIVSFTSPLEHTGAIVYNMATPGESADEVLTDMLVKIKNLLPNAFVTNTNVSYADDGSTIQTLMFTYHDDSNPNIYKVFQLLKTIKGETFLFTYYSTESLFDRFFPLVSQMYKSYQVPSFDNVFPTDVYAGESPHSVDTADQSTTNQDKFLTYNNKTLGLEIQYPTWMNKTEQDGGVEFMFPNKRAGVLLATSNVQSASNESYVTTHLRYLNKSLDNLYVINTSRSDVMGYPTAKILFTYNNSTELYKAMHFWKIKDDQARLFTYFAPSKGVFDDLLPTIDRMLKTIKVS